MDNKKMDISVMVNKLADMATITDADIEALSYELKLLSADIEKKENEIKAETPNKADYDFVRGSYQDILNSARNELAEHERNLAKLESSLKQSYKSIREFNAKEKKLKEEQEALKNNLHEFESAIYVDKKGDLCIGQTKKNIEDINTQIDQIDTKRIRTDNTIKVFQTKKADLEKKIQNCQTKINEYSLLLKSDKYLDDHSLLKDKKKRKQIKIKERKELVARQKEIEHSPLYLADKIEKKIENKEDLDEILLLVKELATLVSTKPYMKEEIYNSNSDKLENELANLEKEQEELTNKLKTNKYVLSDLAIGNERLDSLDHIADISQKQKELLEQLNDLNQELESYLFTKYTNSQTDYKNTLNSIDNYTKGMDDLEDSQKLANMKVNQRRMQEIADYEKEIVNSYLPDISSALKASKDFNDLIESRNTQIDNCKNEKNQLKKRKKMQVGKIDIITKGSDEKKLAQLDIDIKWLEKRLKYKDVTSVKGLVWEINRMIKNLYPKKKIEKKNTEIIKPQEINLNHITALKVDNLKNEEKQEEVKVVKKAPAVKEVKKTTPKIDLHLDLKAFEKDLQDDKQSEKEFTNIPLFAKKQEPKEKKNLEPTTFESLLKPLNAEITNSKIEDNLEKPKVESNIEPTTFESLLKPFNAPETKKDLEESKANKEVKIKVIKVEPLIKTDVQDNEKIKVVKIEKMNKQQEVSDEKPIKVVNIQPITKDKQNVQTNDKMYNGFIFTPFAPDTSLENIVTRKIA